MHSDQTRKDGTSESLIQALYYDFVANYVKTRMYSTRYVQCNSGGQSSADRGATESGSAEVLSSQRSCYSTECEETGHLLPTSGGGGWSRSYTRPLLLEVKKYVVVLFSSWPDVQYKCNSGDTIPCEGAGMHAKVHLLIARSCRLPRCNSLDDEIKLNGMHRSIVHIL